MLRNGLGARLARAGLAGLLAAIIVGPIEEATGQPGPQQVRATTSRRLVSAEGPVITVNFPGGPLPAFVEALRHAAPDQPVNIAVQDRAQRFMVPPVSLRNVTVYTALITLQSIADSRGDEYIGIDASSPQDPEASPAFMIGVNKRTVSGGPGTPPTPERVTRSLSLRELIDGGAAAGGMAPEVILSAVDGVLQLEDKEGAEPAQVKFHKDSGLLLIRGTHQQIAAVEEALDRLTASVKRERALAGSNKAADARRKLDLERAKINVESMQANFQRAAAHFARIREAAAQGTVAQEEVEQAEAQAQNAQQGLRLAQAELDAVAAGSSAPPEGRGDAGDGRPKDADAAIQALQTENQALRRRIEELERRGEKGPQKR